MLLEKIVGEIVKMKKNALVVGGSNGIGLALTLELLDRGYDKVVVVDRCEPDVFDAKIEYVCVNLLDCDYKIFEEYQDIDTLIITAGFGRVAEFNSLTEAEIINSFKVNSVSAILIIKKFYHKLLQKENFNCAVMGSIAGLVSSPLFSVYSATKAAVCKFTEAINVELEKNGSRNRILNVSPGSIKGTKFNGGQNELQMTQELAKLILNNMEQKCEVLIPEYETIYKTVIERYNENPRKYGLESYEYKVSGNRITEKPQVKIGYLTGTFDLFHVGHLNLLRRAKQYCDYLIVGVHKDASHKGKKTFVSFDERMSILQGIKYVDEVVPSFLEDTDAYDEIKYDYLFVGSDYKGTERFARYEEFFKDKNVEIIYFPYTEGTSSTKIRAAIDLQLEKK